MNRVPCLLALAAALLAAPARGDQINLSFDVVPGSAITFNTASGTFDFGDANGTTFLPAPPLGVDFGIEFKGQTVTAGGGPPVFTPISLYGQITGTYALAGGGGGVGSETGVEEVGTPGTHKLVIFDGTGYYTADVDFGSLKVTDGGLSISGGITLSNPVYSGSDATLVALAAFGTGSINLSVPLTVFDAGDSPVPITLDYLTTPQAPGHSPAQSVYSGTITAGNDTPPAGAVPAPAGLLLMGVGSLALGGARLVRRRTPAPA